MGRCIWRVLYSTSHFPRLALTLMLGVSAFAQVPREVVPGMHADEIISEYGEPRGKAIGDNGRENWVYPQFLVRLQNREVVSVRHNQAGGSATFTKTGSPVASTVWYTPAGRPIPTHEILAQLMPEPFTATAAASTPVLPTQPTAASAGKSPSEKAKTPLRRIEATDNLLRVTPATDTGKYYWNPVTFLTAVALMCAILALVVRVGARKRRHPYLGAAPLPGSSATSPIVMRPDLPRTGQK